MTDEEFRAIIAAGPAVVMVRHMIALLDERDTLRAENARLRDALQFYGGHDPENSDHGNWVEMMNEDGGDTARAALAGEVKP